MSCADPARWPEIPVISRPTISACTLSVPSKARDRRVTVPSFWKSQAHSVGLPVEASAKLTVSGAVPLLGGP